MTLPRFGPRVLITTGMMLGGLGMTYLTQISVTTSYLTGVLPALIVAGLGFGSIFAPAINTATAGVSRADSGVASALVNTMQQVGGSIGTAALSTVALTATANYLADHHGGQLVQATAAVHGYTIAFTVSACLFAVGAVLAFAAAVQAAPGGAPGRGPGSRGHCHCRSDWHRLSRCRYRSRSRSRSRGQRGT